MSDNWQIVRQRAERDRDERRVYVSLNKQGEIVMNAEAYRRIGEPGSVTLLYDAAAERIGVKFPVTADRNFFPVRQYGREGRNLIVRGARLLKQFGVKVARTLIFSNVGTEMFEGKPMLVLDLRAARFCNRAFKARV